MVSTAPLPHTIHQTGGELVVVVHLPPGCTAAQVGAELVGASTLVVTVLHSQPTHIALVIPVDPSSCT